MSEARLDKPSVSTTNRSTLVVRLCNTMSSCELIHDRTIEYGSPNGRARLTIGTVGIKPEIRIRLRSSNREKLVYEDPFPPREFYIRFSQVYWTPDSQRVAAYVLAGDSPPVFLAFDVANQASIDPKPFRDKIAQKITEDYGLKVLARENPKFDAMRWAATTQDESRPSRKNRAR